MENKTYFIIFCPNIEGNRIDDISAKKPAELIKDFPSIARIAIIIFGINSDNKNWERILGFSVRQNTFGLRKDVYGDML